MSDHETTLRAYHTASLKVGDLSKLAAACLAGADALRRGTCANCDHRIDWPDAIGCNNARGLGRDEVSPDDFCSEWAPRKDAPTEPTR
jgi:hypothetical protein